MSGRGKKRKASSEEDKEEYKEEVENHGGMQQLVREETKAEMAPALVDNAEEDVGPMPISKLEVLAALCTAGLTEDFE